MLALERAIQTRFAGIAWPNGASVSGLLDSVPKGTAKPYCAKYQIPGRGTVFTFRDQDNSLLTIEPYAVQFSLVVNTGREVAWALINALDAAILGAPILVNGCTIGMKRLLPPTVMEMPAQADGQRIHQAVVRYEFDLDNLIPPYTPP